MCDTAVRRQPACPGMVRSHPVVLDCYCSSIGFVKLSISLSHEDVALLDEYTDKQIHDVVAYLETLQ